VPDYPYKMRCMTVAVLALAVCGCRKGESFRNDEATKATPTSLCPIQGLGRITTEVRLVAG
jgi:hypothetical protein